MKSKCKDEEQEHQNEEQEHQEEKVGVLLRRDRADKEAWKEALAEERGCAKSSTQDVTAEKRACAWTQVAHRFVHRVRASSCLRQGCRNRVTVN